MSTESTTARSAAVLIHRCAQRANEARVTPEGIATCETRTGQTIWILTDRTIAAAARSTEVTRLSLTPMKIPLLGATQCQC